jgi:hypothetical protein
MWQFFNLIAKPTRFKRTQILVVHRYATEIRMSEIFEQGTGPITVWNS